MRRAPDTKWLEVQRCNYTRPEEENAIKFFLSFFFTLRIPTCICISYIRTPAPQRGHGAGGEKQESVPITKHQTWRMNFLAPLLKDNE